LTTGKLLLEQATARRAPPSCCQRIITAGWKTPAREIYAHDVARKEIVANETVEPRR
jgi:hypothetical protein